MKETKKRAERVKENKAVLEDLVIFHEQGLFFWNQECLVPEIPIELQGIAAGFGDIGHMVEGCTSGPIHAQKHKGPRTICRCPDRHEVSRNAAVQSDSTVHLHHDLPASNPRNENVTFREKILPASSDALSLSF